jgi:hypothetical protein
MECLNQKKNDFYCNCTYSCSRKKNCCECIAYHRRSGQLPACYFPDDVEKSYDRSINNFIRVVQERGTSYLK